LRERARKSKKNETLKNKERKHAMKESVIGILQQKAKRCIRIYDAQ